VRQFETGIPGLIVVEPEVHGDERGYFMELWHATRYGVEGLPDRFVQANVSRSSGGVIRGLHYQYPQPQGKLVSVLEGSVFDVAADIRVGSPTFGQWAGIELSAGNHRQLYVPAGMAHGFCVLGDSAMMVYMCTAEYNAEADAAIAWNDPDIAVDWPRSPRRMSAKDKNAPRLSAVPEDQLPRFQT